MKKVPASYPCFLPFGLRRSIVLVRLTAVLIVLLLASGTAKAQRSKFVPPPSAASSHSVWPVVGEAAGGIAVGAIATAATWTGLYYASGGPSSRNTENQQMMVALTGLFSCMTVYPLGSAAGATIAGDIAKQHGTYWASAAGAGIGTVAGFGCFVLGTASWLGPVVEAGFCVLAFAAPPAGAVIGYNLSNRARTEGGLGSRLLAPEVSFEPVRPVSGERTTFRANLRLIMLRL